MWKWVSDLKSFLGYKCRSVHCKTFEYYSVKLFSRTYFMLIDLLKNVGNFFQIDNFYCHASKHIFVIGFVVSNWMSSNGYSSSLTDTQTAELMKIVGVGPYLLEDQCSSTSGRFINEQNGWVKGIILYIFITCMYWVIGWIIDSNIYSIHVFSQNCT